MIRTIGMLTATAFLASACAGDSDTKLANDCVILAADPEAQENFADMNADTESFCACLVELTDAKSVEDQTSINLAMATITAKMQETGQGAEDVIGPMMSQAMAQPDDEEAQALITGVQKTGNLIDEIQDAFEAGTCSRG